MVWLRGFYISVLLAVLLSGCGGKIALKEHSRRLYSEEEIVRGNPVYKIGSPYKIRGKLYKPRVNYKYKETGVGSWYGPKFHNRRTANGEIFDENALTAAHRTLPLPSYVLVTNLQNGRSARLRVNDRGPFAKGRIIDVSKQAARFLGFEAQGTTLVRVQILAKESRILAEQMKRGGAATLYPRKGKGKRARASPRASLIPSAQAAEIAPPRKAESSWRIYAQVGAFRESPSLKRARVTLEKLQLGLPIVEQSVENNDLTRLLLGPLEGYEDARIEALLDRLNRAGFVDSRVRVLVL